jgi:hypothetical protein
VGGVKVVFEEGLDEEVEGGRKVSGFVSDGVWSAIIDCEIVSYVVARGGWEVVEVEFLAEGDEA